ncbi:hypothetical protein WME94_26415 [Sorangium sp. So ce429]
MVNYINVPVPEGLVPEVMALIATRSGAAAPVATKVKDSDEAPAGVESASAEWTEIELRKLWDESGKAMREALGLMVAHSGKAVSGDQIAKALGKKERGHTVAGMMGAFGRRLKHRHKGRWPFTARWNAVDAYWEYKMDASVAANLAKVIAAATK